MNLCELFLLAVGLAMDAFTVSICKGLSMNKTNYKKAVLIGLWFGLFQMLMPLAGFFLGSRFSSFITGADHWIAFVLLGAIGINMIREALKDLHSDSCSLNDHTDFVTMLTLAVATSIDALAIGVTFSLLEVNILFCSAFIGAVTFFISFAGVILGRIFGKRMGTVSQIAGGIILISLGLKILIEDLLF